MDFARTGAVIIGSVGGLTLLGGLALLVVRGNPLFNLSPAGPAWFAIWGLLIGGGFITGMAVWVGTIRGGSPAESLEIGPEGVRLRWNQDSSSSFRWSSRGIR